MKISPLFFTLLLVATTIACGGSQENSEKNKQSAEQNKQTQNKKENMMEVDLSDYNIMATILIPNENVGKPQIQENAMGGVTIEVGDQYGIEIIPFGMSKAEFREELMNNAVFSIEMKEESEEHMLYKKTILDSDVEPEFHFFLNKEINGELYEIRSINNESFSERSQYQMFESAQSLNGKPIS